MPVVPGLGPHGLRGLEVPADGVPGDAQVFGDPPNGTAPVFISQILDLFHSSHLQQSVSGASTETS